MINPGKQGERDRSFDEARHPLREKGRKRFIEGPFAAELKALVPDPRSIVVFGAGDGLEIVALRRQFPEAFVVGLEFSEAEIEGARSSLSSEGNLVRGDWDYPPFAPGSFDLAIFFAALHHSENLERTLGQVLATLRPGGWVYATHEPMASLLLGGFQKRRMARIGEEEGGIETSPGYGEYREALDRSGFVKIGLGPCAMNEIRLLDLDEGFSDVRLRRSDFPERSVRFFLRLSRPARGRFGKKLRANLIFFVQRLALGLFGVTVRGQKPE